MQMFLTRKVRSANFVKVNFHIVKLVGEVADMERLKTIFASIFLLALLAFAVFPVPVGAQMPAGIITGTVADPTGAAIPDAHLIVENVGTGYKLTGTTATDGVFRFSGVAVGQYMLTVEKDGFRRHKVGPFSVQVDSETTIDVALQLGAIQEEIIVGGQILELQTTTSSLGAVVSEQSVRDLPLNGRNFTQLGLLQAGVIPRSPGLTEAANISPQNSFAVNGAREENNLWLLDGGVNQNLQANDVGFLPTVDSIQEFKILTNAYSAQYGTQAGGIINIVTKSGSNMFHGTVWEFFRNDVLDARNFFAVETERLQRNQFGFTAGGPIVKDRAFFFGAYEGTRQRKGIVQATTVPTQAERGGDFSHLNPAPVLCTDPGAICDPLTGLPFPGNMIAANRIDAVALNLLGFYPLPNIPGAPPDSVNFQSAPGQSVTRDQVQIRIDYLIGESDSLNGFWGLETGHSTDPFQLQVFPTQFPGFSQFNPIKPQVARLNWVHTLTPRTVNTLSYTFTRTRTANFFEPPIDPNSIGISLNSPPGVGLPATQIAGFSGVGNGTNGPFDAFSNSFQISDGISHDTGRHLLRAGFEVVWDQSNALLGFLPNGNFVFDGFFTGNALADFMLGTATVFVFPTPNDREKLYVRQYSLAAYFHDDFRLLPNLTLNLGVRYDYFDPFQFKRRAVSTLVVDTPSTPGIPQSGTLRRLFPGDEGLPAGSIYHKDRNDLAPRIGLAWMPFGRDSRLVMRSGFGLFYSKALHNLPLASNLTEPFRSLVIRFASPLADPLTGTQLGQAVFNIPVDVNLKTAYMLHWNLNLQYQFTDGVLFTAGYAGSAGRRFSSFRELNQPIFIPGASDQLNADSRRPFAGFSSLLYISDFPRSSYNSLQLSLAARAFHGLTLNAAYTFSKTIDVLSQFSAAGGNAFLAQVPQDDNCRECDRGVSNFDRRQRLVLSYIYELPFGRGRHYLNNAGRIQEALIGGWQIQGITTFQDGAPFSARDLSDQCLLPGLAGSPCRPDLIGSPNLPTGQRTAQRWFNTSAFQLSALGRGGTAGRNILRSQGINNTDFAFTKSFFLDELREGARLEFRGEFFNIFNKTHFDLPLSDASSANFGAISNTLLDPRQIQFALKLNW